MKKLLLFLTVIFWTSTSFGNPITLPYVVINELYFENDVWYLELAYYEANEQDYPIVSIEISTQAGEAQLLNYTILGESGLIVVQNNELLSEPLFINPDGDFVHITWGVDVWGSIWFEEADMLFGEYPNSTLTKPKPGQSLASNNSNAYSKDDSPTIGFANDTTGMMGTLYGTVYNLNLEPVTEQTFLLLTTDDFWFSTSQAGTYINRVFSNIYDYAFICHRLATSPPGMELIDAEIHYTMEPDSVVNYDIYLLEDITVGITEPAEFNAGCFRFFPNPVKKELSLNYEINYSGNDQNLLIEIKSIASEQIFKYPVATGEGIITLPVEISPGVYFVNLLMGENLLSSGKLVINR